MTLELRTQALLELVEQDRRAHCDVILGEAQARASALLRDARAKARLAMREAFSAERRQAGQRVDAARAKLQTRRRQHEQQRDAALLALGWQQLPDALSQRWRRADQRRAWVDAIIGTALRVLPHAQWQIAHGPDWPAGEREALAARIAAELESPPAFVEDAGIAAGLRVSARGNVVDGTRSGLIADRVEIGARLLRHLEQGQ